MSKYLNREQDNWDVALPYVVSAYNTAPQEATRHSPFVVVHGREPVSIFDATMPALMEVSDDPRTDFTERMLRYVGTARALAKELADQAKSNNIARRFSDNYRELQVGDRVLLHNPKRTVGLSDKLTRNYYGPYKIIDKFNNGVNMEI